MERLGFGKGRATIPVADGEPTFALLSGASYLKDDRLLPAGLAPDWPGQINAQLLGLAATAALTVALVGGLFLILRVLLSLWRSIPAPAEEE